MAKDKNIGIDAVSKKHQCVNCGEPFNLTEFGSYFLSKGNTQICLRCDTPNYLVEPMGAAFWTLMTISILIGLAFLAAFALIIPMWTFKDGDGTMWISGTFAFIGASVGIFVGRAIMKGYAWSTGYFSDDMRFKD